MNEIGNENAAAATTISSALRGHKGRRKHKLLSNYPQQASRRVQDVSNMQPSTQMQTIPRTRTSRPTRYIPPHIDTPTQEQREASIRALLRQVETTEGPLYGMSQSSTKAATKTTCPSSSDYSPFSSFTSTTYSIKLFWFKCLFCWF